MDCSTPGLPAPHHLPVFAQVHVHCSTDVYVRCIKCICNCWYFQLKMGLWGCIFLVGLPRWLSGKAFASQCRRHRFGPWVRKIPWRRKWQPTPVFLPGKCHRQRSLAGYSPWDPKNQTHDLATEPPPPPPPPLAGNWKLKQLNLNLSLDSPGNCLYEKYHIGITNTKLSTKAVLFRKRK